MQSVIIIDYLIVNDDNIGPEEIAPNAAPMAGKAIFNLINIIKKTI